MIECHGTGTKLGDPIEANALRGVFGSPVGGRDDFRDCKLNDPLPILSSRKTSMGHLEGGAGLAGLLGALAFILSRHVQPVVHFRRMNIHIEGSPDDDAFAVVLESSGRLHLPLATGASSFGFGGTNAHAVL